MWGEFRLLCSLLCVWNRLFLCFVSFFVSATRQPLSLGSAEAGLQRLWALKYLCDSCSIRKLEKKIDVDKKKKKERKEKKGKEKQKPQKKFWKPSGFETHPRKAEGPSTQIFYGHTVFCRMAEVVRRNHITY